MACAQRGYIAPEIDADSARWWNELERGVFTLPFCRACHHRFFPPMPACPKCGSAGWDVAPASGRGVVYSWVVVHRALDDAFAKDVPYCIVAVDLDEGPRMFGRLCVAPPYRLDAGDPVGAVVYPTAGRRLLGFAPWSSEAQQAGRNA